MVERQTDDRTRVFGDAAGYGTGLSPRDDAGVFRDPHGERHHPRPNPLDAVMTPRSRRGLSGARSGRARPADAEIALLTVSLFFAASVGAVLWRTLSDTRDDRRRWDDGQLREHAARFQV